MRRFLRWTWNVLAVLSLLLCVAVAALWIRSYWRVDAVSRGTTDGMGGVRSDRGRLVCGRYVVFGDDPPPPEWWWDVSPAPDDAPAGGGDLLRWESDPDGRARRASVAGLEWGSDDGPDPDDIYAVFEAYSAWYVIVPYWILAAVAAAPAVARVAFGLKRRRRDSRRGHGRCPACGYDLTGNTSGVCPECGTPAEKGVSP